MNARGSQEGKVAGSERGVRNALQHYPTHCTCDEKCGSFPEVSEVGVAHGLVALLGWRGSAAHQT